MFNPPNPIHSQSATSNAHIQSVHTHAFSADQQTLSREGHANQADHPRSKQRIIFANPNVQYDTSIYSLPSPQVSKQLPTQDLHGPLQLKQQTDRSQPIAAREQLIPLQPEFPKVQFVSEEQMARHLHMKSVCQGDKGVLELEVQWESLAGEASHDGKAESKQQPNSMKRQHTEEHRPNNPIASSENQQVNGVKSQQRRVKIDQNQTEFRQPTQQQSSPASRQVQQRRSALIFIKKQQVSQPPQQPHQNFIKIAYEQIHKWSSEEESEAAQKTSVSKRSSKERSKSTRRSLKNKKRGNKKLQSQLLKRSESSESSSEREPSNKRGRKKGRKVTRKMSPAESESPEKQKSNKKRAKGRRSRQRVLKKEQQIPSDSEPIATRTRSKGEGLGRLKREVPSDVSFTKKGKKRVKKC